VIGLSQPVLSSKPLLTIRLEQVGGGVTEGVGVLVGVGEPVGVTVTVGCGVGGVIIFFQMSGK